MKSLVIPLSLFFLVSCTSKPANTPAPTPQPTETPKATAKPSPIPSASVPAAATLQQLITSSELNLKVGEEIMLIGDAVLSDGSKVSIDSIQNRLNLTNQTPELLALNTDNRLLKALKAGTAVIQVAAKDNPSLQVLVRVMIADNAETIDPNVALVDVQVN